MQSATWHCCGSVYSEHSGVVLCLGLLLQIQLLSNSLPLLSGRRNHNEAINVPALGLVKSTSYGVNCTVNILIVAVVVVIFASYFPLSIMSIAIFNPFQAEHNIVSAGQILVSVMSSFFHAALIDC